MAWQRIERGLTVVLAVSAVALAAVTIKREFFRGRELPPPPGSIVSVKRWKQFAVGRNTRGTAGAPVVIVEFSDFQCPYCAKVGALVSRLMEQCPGEITLVYRHYPVSANHPMAMTAALASECSADQHRFWEFHDLAFGSPDTIATGRWESIAKGAGIPDLHAFLECVKKQDRMDLVARDTVAGARLGVRGTPTLLVNAQMVHGLPPEQVLVSLVEAALKKR